MVYADETEPSTRRSGLNRFNPKRLSFFSTSSSTRSSPTATPSSSTAPSPASSPKIAQGSARQHRPIVIAPTDSPLSSTKRKVAPSPYTADAPVFTSPFTNPSPFSTPPPPSTPSFTPVRRSSSEARAIAANRLKATVAAVKTAPGKRRKSVVDLEEATEGVKNLFTRRRSSLTPIQPPSAAPRSSLLHYTPANPEFLENSPSRTTSGHHVVAPSGVRIGFPLTFPSPVPSSPLPERRAAFSDHALSPNLSFLDTPSLGSASPTLTASSFRSSPTMSPRSPHSSSTRDLEPETWEGPRGHRRLPSGVLINWPPVFPSRPPSMAFSGTSVEDVDESEVEEDKQEEREEFAREVLANEDRDETPSFRRRGAPTFIRRVPPPSLASASPFPPPFLSDKDRANSDDSFRNFSFPSMPTLFAQTPTALPPSSANRRVSTCSSYNSPHGSGVNTPGSFDPDLLTPLGTGITIYEANPFSEAFGAAGGLAIRTTQRV